MPTKSNMNKIKLAGLTYNELEDFVTANNEPKFRAGQLHLWLYRKPAADFDGMTDLSKDFREKLKAIAVITDTQIAQKQISKDGTIKYLLEYTDGAKVETVLMRYDNRPNLTACISTQIGCAAGCTFCATGKNGFRRNLTAREMVEQVMIIQRDSGYVVTNLVFMGQGEPLLNYDETANAIRILNSEMAIGIRRMTVSTCGIVPGIYRLPELNRQLNLALSLHAPDHELRKQLMPIENKYHIDDVIKAMRAFSDRTRRRLTIEYLLIAGVNDEISHAHKVNELLKGLKYNVNLIPYNSVDTCGYQKPSRERVQRFKEVLETVNKKITVRVERGSDIAAACGQLAGQAES
jgi:23S rRNA (adenine2503-C2)-methyltransferase